MTPETSLSGSISTRPCTVVRARRLRIRHLRPGDAYIEQIGADQRVSQDGLPEGGLKFTRAQRAFYAANLKLAQSGLDPYALLARLGMSSHAVRSPRSVQSGIAREPRIMKRKIALAVMALIVIGGIARHVHLSPGKITDSFRTRMAAVDAYWVALRAKPTDQPVVLANSDMQPVVEETAAALPQVSAPDGTQPQQQPATGGTYGSGYRIQAMGNIMPMPSYEPGPLPPGMLPYQPPGGPVGLLTHPAFTEPDDGSENGAQPEDTVTLLTTQPAVAVAPEQKHKEERRDDREVRKPTTRSSEPVKVVVHSAHSTPQTVAQAAAPAQQQAAQPQAPAPAAPSQQSQQSQAPSDNDVVLLGQKVPGGQDGQDGGSADAGGPTNQAVREVQADAGTQSESSQDGQTDDQPRHPSFRVVTHTDNSVVVQVNGEMKQISIGQALPDGAKLLRVDHSGGGFTTSRGKYAAY
jgi:hypothetical protein